MRAGNKKSLRPVPMSLRGKKRYIAFELVAEKAVDRRVLDRELEELFVGLYGEKGFAEQRGKLVEFDGFKGIMRCSLETCEQAKAGLLFLQGAAGAGVVPRIIVVSGSLAKAKGFL